MLRALFLSELALFLERFGRGLLGTAKRVEHAAINAWADYSIQQSDSGRSEIPELSGHLQ